MHSAKDSEIEYLKNLKRKICTKNSNSIVEIEPNNGFELIDLKCLIWAGTILMKIKMSTLIFKAHILLKKI